MGLYIHIAKTKEDAIHTEVAICLEWHIHKLIFGKIGLLENSFPLFKRMEDFYKDTHYHYSELKSLNSEILEIKKIFVEERFVQERLSKIENLFIDAQENSLNIWAFCD